MTASCLRKPAVKGTAGPVVTCTDCRAPSCAATSASAGSAWRRRRRAAAVALKLVERRQVPCGMLLPSPPLRVHLRAGRQRQGHLAAGRSGPQEQQGRAEGGWGEKHASRALPWRRTRLGSCSSTSTRSGWFPRCRCTPCLQPAQRRPRHDPQHPCSLPPSVLLLPRWEACHTHSSRMGRSRWCWNPGGWTPCSTCSAPQQTSPSRCPGWWLAPTWCGARAAAAALVGRAGGGGRARPLRCA